MRQDTDLCGHFQAIFLVVFVCSVDLDILDLVSNLKSQVRDFKEEEYQRQFEA